MSLTHVSYLWANSDQATMSLSNGSGILETHGHLMWDDHYDSIIAPLPAVVDLEHHHIYSIIFDSLVDRFNMRHVTYVNCIFLTAIYGPSHGPRTPRVQGWRGPDQGSYFPPPHLHGDHPAAWYAEGAAAATAPTVGNAIEVGQAAVPLQECLHPTIYQKPFFILYYRRYDQLRW
ncbi:hypothetical protein BHE90_010510 [Fusarium euwallaceae]|uniref:Uncharacterized protein n=1 Tax=Fusarium euwallaceae TaxID=1147111 RepID=A0A430LH59_9HYPO|nr:hypothetical protein BHE90_010510 [Fusarium euwallaceae]